MQKLLIGLSGLAGSGKSTASQIISNAYNIPRRPFAFPLKCMIGALGIPREVLEGPAAVKELPTARLGGKSVRYALQTLGTEWGRNYMGADFWVQQWMLGLDTLPGAVADDCRFENEVDAIYKLGGIVIRLDRPGSGVKEAGGSAHASEMIGNLPFNYRITNDGTREELDVALRHIIDRHFNFPPAQQAFWPKAGSFE